MDFLWHWPWILHGAPWELDHWYSMVNLWNIFLRDQFIIYSLPRYVNWQHHSTPALPVDPIVLLGTMPTRVERGTLLPGRGMFPCNSLWGFKRQTSWMSETLLSSSDARMQQQMIPQEFPMKHKTSIHHVNEPSIVCNQLQYIHILQSPALVLCTDTTSKQPIFHNSHMHGRCCIACVPNLKKNISDGSVHKPSDAKHGNSA